MRKTALLIAALLCSITILFAQNPFNESLFREKPIKGIFINGDTVFTLKCTEDLRWMELETKASGLTMAYEMETSTINRAGQSVSFSIVTMFGDSTDFSGTVINNVLTGKLYIKQGDLIQSYSNEDGASSPASAVTSTSTSLSGSQPGAKKISAPATDPLIIIIIGSVFLIAFVALSVYLKKIYAELYKAPTDSLSDDASYFPIVRISRKGLMSRRVIILYEDGIAALKIWGSKSIAALHEPGSKKELESFKGAGKIKTIPADEVSKITITPHRLFKFNRIKFKTKAGSFTLRLPVYECEVFTKALYQSFPGKVKCSGVNIPSRLLFGTIITTVFCALFYFFATNSTLLLISRSGERTSMPLSWWVQAVFWLFVLFITVIVPIVFTKFDLYRSSGKHQPAAKLKKDLSHKKPLRSNTLSLVIRFIALGFAIYWGYYYFIDDSGPLINYQVTAIIIGSLLLLSIALAQKATDKLRKNDTRKPILYLRSFLDDNETTLNPCTRWSTFLGVDPPYYWLKERGLESGLRYKAGKTVIKYAYSFWPTRLVRLFFGISHDTSEEQLTRYFKTKGLVVAIGKPGEKIATLGASRLYVTNEEWQQTVLDLLKESQTILLQPSTTDGVWWEIEQVLNKVEPENIILCMVNYRNHQEYYENFYRRFTKLRPDIKIPRSLGNDSQISFIDFNKDWSANVRHLNYYSSIQWPFTGNALNLKKTFKNYFDKITSTET